MLKRICIKIVITSLFLQATLCSFTRKPNPASAELILGSIFVGMSAACLNLLYKYPLNNKVSNAVFSGLFLVPGIPGGLMVGNYIIECINLIRWQKRTNKQVLEDSINFFENYIKIKVFDDLIQIMEKEPYNSKDLTKAILEHNNDKYPFISIVNFLTYKLVGLQGHIEAIEERLNLKSNDHAEFFNSSQTIMIEYHEKYKKINELISTIMNCYKYRREKELYDIDRKVVMTSQHYGSQRLLI